MSRSINIKGEKYTKIRTIYKAFDEYPTETQELIKKEFDLIIYRSVNNKNFDSYADYIPFFKTLTPEERTIIFCGIPIKLGKKQFAILSLLIREQKLYTSEYTELEFKEKQSKRKETANSNLRIFVARFKEKCLKTINSHIEKNSAVFDDKKKILSLLDNLIFYELHGAEYVLLTNFCLKQMRVKKQKH